MKDQKTIIYRELRPLYVIAWNNICECISENNGQVPYHVPITFPPTLIISDEYLSKEPSYIHGVVLGHYYSNDHFSIPELIETKGNKFIFTSEEHAIHIYSKALINFVTSEFQARLPAYLFEAYILSIFYHEMFHYLESLQLYQNLYNPNLNREEAFREMVAYQKMIKEDDKPENKPKIRENENKTQTNVIQFMKDLYLDETPDPLLEAFFEYLDTSRKLAYETSDENYKTVVANAAKKCFVDEDFEYHLK